MARDPLPVLLRARRWAQDDARRALGEGLRAEADAAARIVEMDRTIARECEAMTALSGEEAACGTHAVWLARARHARRQAQVALGAAAERTGALRGQLGEARAATRVAETLLAGQEAERRAANAGQEQRRLDEAGRSRTRG